MQVMCAKALREREDASFQGSEEGRVGLSVVILAQGDLGKPGRADHGNHIKNDVFYYQCKGSHQSVLTVNYITFSLLTYPVAAPLLTGPSCRTSHNAPQTSLEQ